ncbi:MAG: hypothetical protein E7238_00200 [Sarcina sp.]|nr:hypothetical protein [Sarcina sp.]
MYSKEIDGKIYNFKFGIGFVRDIDKTKTVKGDDGNQQPAGLTYAIAGLMDGDFEKLIDCLLYGNKYADGDKLNRATIEAWLESDGVDLEQECKDLLDFFETSNFTRRKTSDLKEAAEKNRALQEATYQAQLAEAKAGTN